MQSQLIIAFLASMASAHSNHASVEWYTQKFGALNVAINNFNVPNYDVPALYTSYDSEHPHRAEFFYNVPLDKPLAKPIVDVYLRPASSNATDMLLQSGFDLYSTDCSCFTLDLKKIPALNNGTADLFHSLVFRNTTSGSEAVSGTFVIDTKYQANSTLPAVKMHLLNDGKSQAYTSLSGPTGRTTWMSTVGAYPSLARFTYSKGIPIFQRPATVDVYLCNKDKNMTDILLDSNFKIMDDSANEYVLDLSRLSFADKDRLPTSETYQLMFKHNETEMGWGPSAVSGYFAIYTSDNTSSASSNMINIIGGGVAVLLGIFLF